MLENMEAVLFDLDGTLADSMGVWKEIDIDYLGRFQIPLPEKLQNEIEGMSFTETACYFKARFGIPDSVEQIKDDWNRMAWDKYASEVSLKPGAYKFVKQCHDAGLKLGIATSNSREIVENFTRVHKISQYFTTIMTACDVQKGKPSPDIYLRTAEVLETKAHNCLVFEDIVAGIQAGKAAGMKVCAVDDVYSAYQRSEKKRLADYYIDSYVELLADEGEVI